jgi:predicted DNA binding protein
VKTVEELYRSSDSLCVRTVTENSRGHPSFSNLFFEAGCIPLAPTRFEGKFEVWTIGGKEKNAVSSAIDKLRKRYEVSIGWVKSASNYASIKLTTRQREALLTAHELGYFTWPRRITATEVAKATHIPKTVFLSHLRKAENKVIESFALRLT